MEPTRLITRLHELAGGENCDGSPYQEMEDAANELSGLAERLTLYRDEFARILKHHLVLGERLAVVEKDLAAVTACWNEAEEKLALAEKEVDGFMDDRNDNLTKLALAEAVCRAVSKTEWADNDTDVSNALAAWRKGA